MILKFQGSTYQLTRTVGSGAQGLDVRASHLMRLTINEPGPKPFVGRAAAIALHYIAASQR